MDSAPFIFPDIIQILAPAICGAMVRNGNAKKVEIAIEIAIQSKGFRAHSGMERRGGDTAYGSIGIGEYIQKYGDHRY